MVPRRAQAHLLNGLLELGQLLKAQGEQIHALSGARSRHLELGVLNSGSGPAAHAEEEYFCRAVDVREAC